jgi:hypothetical protein
MRCLSLLFWFSISSVGLSQSPVTSGQSTGTAVPAIDGVLAAFQNNSLVGLSDWHRLAQEEDFFVSLVSDPRFARQVQNVVVEFGNASQQQTIDRYENGEDISYAELRNVWADTSYAGWLPTVTALGYQNFFAAVRAVNLTLPVNKRIHVWLGGRPVAWSTIRTKEDLSHFLTGEPDRFTADLIEDKILKKGGNALVIYGTFHFYDKGQLGDLIHERHPETMPVIEPYVGFDDKSCSEVFERSLPKAPSPAIIAVRGTDMDQRLGTSSCHFVNASSFAGLAESQKAQLRSEMNSQPQAILGQYLLYLGPAKSLTLSPLSPDLYLDPLFRKEIDRRGTLFGAQPDPWPTVMDNPMAPQYLHDYGTHP